MGPRELSECRPEFARGVLGTWIALNARIFRDPRGDVVCSRSFLCVFVRASRDLRASRQSHADTRAVFAGRSGDSRLWAWMGWLSAERALGTWNRVDSGRGNACASLIFGSDELHALIGRSIRIRYPEGCSSEPIRGRSLAAGFVTKSRSCRSLRRRVWMNPSLRT